MWYVFIFGGKVFGVGMCLGFVFVLEFFVGFSSFKLGYEFVMGICFIFYFWRFELVGMLVNGCF